MRTLIAIIIFWSAPGWCVDCATEKAKFDARANRLLSQLGPISENFSSFKCDGKDPCLDCRKSKFSDEEGDHCAYECTFHSEAADISMTLALFNKRVVKGKKIETIELEELTYEADK